MTRVSPLQFKDAFLKAASSVNSKIVELRPDSRAYTALMLDIIFPKVAEELRINVYNGNYYYLDSIFYSERDSEHFGPNTTYAKCISIAMEHENDIRSAHFEMNKLQLFNAPLKVLITYAPESEHAFYLERYAKIVRDADIFGDFATLRRQLLILGSISEDVVAWHFRAYEPGGFQVI